MAKIKNITNRIVGLLPQSDFVRNVGLVSGGAFASRVLVVLVTPILTRLYTPAEMGVLAVYMALLALVNAVSAWRLESVVPLPEDDAEAANGIAASYLAVAISASLVALVVFFSGDWLVSLFSVPELGGYLWLLPVGILLWGIHMVTGYWMTRKKRFGVLAISSIFASVVLLSIQLGGYQLGVVSLVMGAAFSQVIGIVILMRVLLQDGFLGYVSFTGLRHIFVRYYRFPLFGIWATLFNTTGRQLPPLVFASVFGAASAGFFSLANRVLFTPISLLGIGIGQVFFSRAAGANRDGSLGTMVRSIHDRLAMVAMPPALGLLLVGPEAFQLVFGDEWVEAGEYARWMSLWLYFAFVTMPFTHLFAVLEMQREGFIYNAIVLTSRTAAIFAGVWLGDVMVSVQLFSIASGLCAFGLLYFLLARFYETSVMVFWPSVKATVAGVAVVSPYIIYSLMASSLAGLLISSFFTGLLFSILLFFIVRSFWKPVKDAQAVA